MAPPRSSSGAAPWSARTPLRARAAADTPRRTSSSAASRAPRGPQQEHEPAGPEASRVAPDGCAQTRAGTATDERGEPSRAWAPLGRGPLPRAGTSGPNAGFQPRCCSAKPVPVHRSNAQSSALGLATRQTWRWSFRWCEPTPRCPAGLSATLLSRAGLVPSRRSRMSALRVFAEHRAAVAADCSRAGLKVSLAPQPQSLLFCWNAVAPPRAVTRAPAHVDGGRKTSRTTPRTGLSGVAGSPGCVLSPRLAESRGHDGSRACAASASHPRRRAHRTGARREGRGASL